MFVPLHQDPITANLKLKLITFHLMVSCHVKASKSPWSQWLIWHPAYSEGSQYRFRRTSSSCPRLGLPCSRSRSWSVASWWHHALVRIVRNCLTAFSTRWLRQTLRRIYPGFTNSTLILRTYPGFTSCAPILKPYHWHHLSLWTWTAP
jgi:hypothetical protein